jgi:hypothetical protein
MVMVAQKQKETMEIFPGFIQVCVKKITGKKGELMNGIALVNIRFEG